MMVRIAVLCLAVALGAPLSLAQSPGAAIRAAKKAAKKGGLKQNPQRLAMVERLSRMTPGERERALNSLPPERRKAVERRLEAYQNMTPAERQRMGNQLGQLQDLPPERQQEVRKLYKRFQQMPPERQPLVQQELKSLRGMTPEERQARMNSDEFRSKYNKPEQRFLGELSKALDPEEP